MALFIESDIRARAAQGRAQNFSRSSESLILESLTKYASTNTYDIFLSHSSKDADLIYGMKLTFEDMGYRVYVDWIDDPQLDRKNVTSDTAEKLKQRMLTSRSLFYVTTQNSDSSKWMPWECGFFDGYKGKVAIAPVLISSSSNSYNGQEYLGIYPYVNKQNDTQGNAKLWIWKDVSTYDSFDHWVEEPTIAWKKLS